MHVNPQHQSPWDWRAGIQFICGGTGTGLLFFTALAGLQDSAWLLRGGIPALVFVATGLFFVWIKLGRRWRFHLVVLNPFTSWISREAFFSLPLMALGAIGVLFELPIVALIGSLFGLGFLYAQAQMLFGAKGIPAWREPLIVPLIVLTGLVEGAGLFLVITAVSSPSPLTWTPIVLLLLIAIRFGIWRAYHQKLSTPGAAPSKTTAVLNKINQPIMLFGHGLPLILLIIGFIVPAIAPVTGAVAGLAALLGGWYCKFMLVTRAAYAQGFALTRTPARTPGYSGPGVKPGWK
ncbi:MAG: phenylacetyl-CoA:acceptor oxidoreductase [Chloroflexi bacterium]|nr:phenylacetyl-CoA:acceptor oxidoreductase [Chloroflexota bacterium]